MRGVWTRRLAAVVGITALVLTGEGVPPSDAQRARDVVIEGRGFGHGRGMGQWGARARADNGAHWRSIVAHYYRGAHIERLPRDPAIRVLVRDGARMTFTGPPMRVTWTGGRTAGTTRQGQALRVRRVGDRLVLERAPRLGGTWRRIATARAVFAVRSEKPIWLRHADGSLRAYRGRFRVTRRGAGLAAINIVGLEPYLRGLVPREMPALWPAHALRAQAVAARTYALHVARAARARGASYDICATAACQVYGGVSWKPRHGARTVRLEHPRTDAAVAATRRLVLTRGGAPIFAQYSSSTGGHTNSGGRPYLRPVPDPADRASPYHTWRVRIPSSRIERRWPAIGRLRGVAATGRDGHGVWGGRPSTIVLDGTRGTVRVSASRFAGALGLRSSWVRVRTTTAEHRFRFNMGYGTRHPAVDALQDRLLREGFYPRNAPRTDYFGRITRASLQRYQRAHGISPTGYLGPITRRSLNR